MHKLFIAFALVVGLSLAGPAVADEEPSASNETSSSESESKPSEEPTDEPSEEPTEEPSEEPSEEPTEEPAEEPTVEPTDQPSEEPADEPSEEPADDAESEEEEAPEDDGNKPDADDQTPEEVVEGEPVADSVTICHANGANDFSKESVAADATAGDHDGDTDDVIPEFDYAGGSYAGKNYDDAGKALLDNDCVPVVEEVGAKLLEKQLLDEIIVAAKKVTVTICHATSSVNNPYNVQNPAPDGDVSGHADHTGPVFEVGFVQGDDWGDIIPPFNIDGVSFPGLNWNAEGQAIFNAGCEVAGADPDPGPDPGQVTICHATGSQTFDKVSVTANATVSGHAAHTSDIIPPFDINGVTFIGQNFDDEGEEIFDNDCVREASDDDSDDDDDDSDDSDDDDDDGGLPDTGGSPLWGLLLGGSLIVGGVALVNNRKLAGAGGLLTGPGSPSVPLVPSWSQLAARPVSPSRRHASDFHADPVATEKVTDEKSANRGAWKWTLKASVAVAVVAFLVRHIAK